MRSLAAYLRMMRYLLGAWAPSGYLPAWEDLPAWDALSNSLADEGRVRR